MNASPAPQWQPGHADRIPWCRENGLAVFGDEPLRLVSRDIIGSPTDDQHEGVLVGDSIVFDFQATGAKRLTTLRALLAEAKAEGFLVGMPLTATELPAAHARLRDAWNRVDRFNPVTRNCQTIAREVLYDRPESPAVTKYATIAAVGLLALALRKPKPRSRRQPPRRGRRRR